MDEPVTIRLLLVSANWKVSSVRVTYYYYAATASVRASTCRTCQVIELPTHNSRAQLEIYFITARIADIQQRASVSRTKVRIPYANLGPVVSFILLQVFY